MKHYEVIIVGAGPAGTTCGYTLKRKGINCLIIDKSSFPREKLCAGALGPTTCKLIHKIFPDLKYKYHQINKVVEYLDGHKQSESTDASIITTVIRKSFDYELLKEYLKISGEFQQNEVLEIKEDDKIFINLKDGQSLSCDYLVGADGALSCIRKYLGVDFGKGILWLQQNNYDYKSEAVIIAHSSNFNGGYFYVFPNEEFCSVGYGELNTNLDTFNHLMDQYKIVSNNKTRGAYIPCFMGVNYKFNKRILLIGDAGGYVDSTTGGGLKYAFQTGARAALSIVDKVPFEVYNKEIIQQVNQLACKKMNLTL